jgi:hypothetical protein
MAARTAPASVPSHLRLDPDMKSMPARVATSTSDVPRSGWSITRIQGGPRTMTAPITVQTDVIFSWRPARSAAKTTIMTILASSLNWNWNPAILIQRAEVPASPVFDPIRSVRSSSPMFTR